MKTRDSGMPDQDWWESFFDPEAVLDALGLRQFDGPVIDVGCGYGTFTLAVARRTTHPVIAIDIDPALLEIARIRQTIGPTTPLAGCYTYGEQAPLGSAGTYEHAATQTGSVLAVALGM